MSSSGGVITADQIDDATITATQIAPNTITAAEIATNAITSDEILNATIQTHDLAANSITQTMLSSAFSGSTTSTSYATITGGDVTMTTEAGTAVLLLLFASFKNSASGNSMWLAVNMDGGSELTEQLAFAYTTNNEIPFALCYYQTGASAASHTWRARWKVGGGTATMANGRLVVMEVKR